ncbi:hypothetical protein Nmel_003915 [Mimus melanotis]
MRRRKTAVAASCCLAFLLGTLLNLLFIPGSEHPPPPREELPPSPPGAPLYPPEEEIGGGQAALARQIRERYEEVLRYRQHRAAAAGRRPLRPRERRLMDLAPPRTSAEQPRPPGPRGRAAAGPRGRAAAGPWAGASAELSLEPPLLGCRDIRDVSGVQYLGSGYTKAVYKAVLNRTLAVALKAVDFGGHDIAHCVRQFSALGDCYRLAAYKIVKEMILLQRLRHANVLQVRGSGRGGRAASPGSLHPAAGNLSELPPPVPACAGSGPGPCRAAPESSRTQPRPLFRGQAQRGSQSPGQMSLSLARQFRTSRPHRVSAGRRVDGRFPLAAAVLTPRRQVNGPGGVLRARGKARSRAGCGIPPSAWYPPAAAGRGACALILLPHKQNEY